MAKSKSGQKLTAKEMEELDQYYKQYLKANKVKVVNKNSKQYKAQRGLMLRLKATAAVMIASMGTIAFMAKQTNATYNENVEEIGKVTLTSIVPTSGNRAIKLESDGTEIELTSGDIAIVQGKILEGENRVVVLDEDGNQIEVCVSSQNLSGAIEMSGEKLEDYVIYQVTSTEGADLIQTGDEVSNVSYGDFVIGKEQHDEEVYVIYPTQDGILTGKVDERMLEVVNELTTDQYRDPSLVRMVVDTSTDKYAKLNFRSTPDYEKYSIMMQIPNGTIIDSTGETIFAEGREWTKIQYEGQTGWVATEYLKEFTRQEQLHEQEEQEQMQQQEQEQIQQQEQQLQETNAPEHLESEGITNMSGGVTIIDVSTMTPKQLRTILQNGIPIELSTDNGTIYNTQGVAGKINGVLIKIGASTYGKGEFKQSDYDSYRELVAVCEELCVPYGLYLYSTAINKEEANMEVQYAQNVIKELRSEFDMEYYKLPFVWDRELTGTSDRQYGKDVTDIVAYQINATQANGISEKVLLYTAGRIVDEHDSDQIIDLERVKASLTNPDDFAIWLCAPVARWGNETQSTTEYIDMIENKYQVPVVNEQRYLDVNALTGGKMDVGSMDLYYYNALTGEKENDVVAEQAEVEEDER